MAVDMTQQPLLCQRSDGDLAAHMRDLAADRKAAKLPDRATELRRLAAAIEAEMPTLEEARSQSIRAFEAVSLGCHPRSVAIGSRVRLHRVSAGGLPCWCPRVTKHKPVGPGVAATEEILVRHRSDYEVEP